MEKMVIFLIVGLAGWYLVHRYLRNKKAEGVCGCSDGSCDIKNRCSACQTEEIALKGQPNEKKDLTG